MKPTIVVDANPLISALIGGYSREILFNHNFRFITTEFTISEVKKYLPDIAQKADVTVEYLESMVKLFPLTIFSKTEYDKYVSNAEKLIKDQKDIDILALSLAKNFPLWTNDKHFENIKEITLIKTKDFV